MPAMSQSTPANRLLNADDLKCLSNDNVFADAPPQANQFGKAQAEGIRNREKEEETL
jgi:hypothetical protein